MHDARIIDNLAAEAIGVFMLCFVGIWSINNLATAESGLIGIALAQGLAIMVMVAALAHVSGAHFNPAVTLALLLGRHINLGLAAMYWAAQILGGLVAAVGVAALAGTDIVAGGTPALANGVSLVDGIVLEATATFLLVLVVYGTAVDKKAPASIYPVAIGLSITAGILAIGPLTGGALNPARWFGPALVAGDWGNALVWTAGPLLGGVLGWAVHDFLIRPTASDEAVAESARRAR